MKIAIKKIKVPPGRRKVELEAVEKLAGSMDEVGLANPITVDAGYRLVAGLHRLEAAKLLGWTEVECSVLELDPVQAKIMEIDENLFRTSLSDLELGRLLASRKKLYEELHPEKRHGGDRRSAAVKPPNCRDGQVKSFAEDAAERLGVSPRTVERRVQIAERLSDKTCDILKGIEGGVTQQTLEKLSRLDPEQQEEAAGLLARGKIKTIDQYGIQPDQWKDKSAGYDSAALYTQTFEEAAMRICYLTGLVQERQETYFELLSTVQQKKLVEFAAQAAASLERFIKLLGAQPGETGDGERRVS